MRILVCGGRFYGRVPDFPTPVTDLVHQAMVHHAKREHHALWECLDRVGAKAEVVIHGMAQGADRIAHNWAISTHREILAFPADWDKHGKQAGILRNIKMLEEGAPNLVVAARGGKGTEHMVSIAKKAKLPVIRVWVV